MIREHRLYQADWLMRHYGFGAEEITTDDQPDLDLAVDPKLAWARRHPEYFPVDVNAAPRESLLRVPGLGYRNVDRILSIRRYHQLGLEDLRKLHVRLKDASAYLVAVDHLPADLFAAAAGDAGASPAGDLLQTTRDEVPALQPTQLGLFEDAARSALWGAL